MLSPGRSRAASSSAASATSIASSSREPMSRSASSRTCPLAHLDLISVHVATASRRNVQSRAFDATPHRQMAQGRPGSTGAAGDETHRQADGAGHQPTRQHHRPERRLVQQPGDADASPDRAPPALRRRRAAGRLSPACGWTESRPSRRTRSGSRRGTAPGRRPARARSSSASASVKCRSKAFDAA